MIGQTAAQFCFDFFFRLPIVVEPKEVGVSSDTGILPIRQFDSQIGFASPLIAGWRRLDAVHSAVGAVHCRLLSRCVCGYRSGGYTGASSSRNRQAGRWPAKCSDPTRLTPS